MHEPTSTSGRVIIATTATLSLLLVGLLALSMTPDPGTDPTTVGSSASGSSGAALARPTRPLVTPIGDDGWGLTTAGAARKRSGSLAARLPNGDEINVEIVGRDADSGLTVVSLPAATDGYQLAASRPEPSDAVRVGGEPPQVVPMVAVRNLDVEEAAPVIDGEGELVGLCTTDRHGDVVIRTVSTMPGQTPATSTTVRPATTVTSAPTTGAPTTLAPATTVGVTSTTVPATSTTVAPTTSSSPSTTAPSTSAPSPSLSGGAGAPTAPG